MVTRHPAENFEELVGFLQSLPFDPRIAEYRDTMFRSREVDRLLLLGKQFLYVIDYTVPEIIHVSHNIKEVLGYDSETMKLKALFDIIHPADRIKVIRATQRTIEILTSSGQTGPCDVSAQVNYRLQKANGTYIHVLGQTTVFKTDKQGNILFTLGTISDIDYLKPGKKVELKILGLNQDTELAGGVEMDVPDEIFSQREIEIINLIAEGNKSAEIAERLSISHHTVLTHRKNILKKAELNNTAELLMFSKENGII